MENLIGRKTKKLKYSLIAMALSMAIVFLIYSSFGIFPGGDRVISILDMDSQYINFLMRFRDDVLSLSSPLYSFKAGLGQNLLGHMGYYTASPLNLVLILFPRTYINEGIYFLLLLKLGLMAFTMNFLLMEAFDERRPESIAFSLAYALSHYSMAYSIHLMWMDALILLPICVLGLVRILRNQGFLLYVLSLALMVGSNFYSAAFACILLVLIFPYLFFSFYVGDYTARNSIRLAGKFFLYSLIGGMLVALIWMPTLKNLAYTEKLGAQPPENKDLIASWPQILSRFLPHAKATIKNGPPNLYLGVLPLIMSISIIFSKDINSKAKISGIIASLFILYSLNSPILNYAWHGFSYPVSFENRFAYSLVFLMIFMAYGAYISHKSTKETVLSGSILILFIIYLISEKPDTQPIANVLVVFLIVLYIFLVLLRPYFTKLGAKINIGSLLICLVMLAESSFVSYQLVKDREEDFGFETRNLDLVIMDKKFKETIAGKDEDIFPQRTSYISGKRINKGSLLDSNSIDIFDSTYYTGSTNFFINMGYMSNMINSVYDQGKVISRPLEDLLGIKYYISQEESFYLDSVGGDLDLVYDDGLIVWENNNALGLGIFTPNDPQALEFDPNHIRDNQNQFFNLLGAEDNIYRSVESFAMKTTRDQDLEENASGNSYSYKIGEDGFYLVNWTCDKLDYNDEIKISINKGAFESIYSSYNRGLYEIGYLQEGDTIDIGIGQSTGESEIYFDLCLMDEKAYASFSQRLKARQLEVLSHRGNSFTGNIDNEEEGYLFIALPYDQGWRIRVNGQGRELINCQGLMAIDLGQGPNLIEGRYIPLKFRLGSSISILSLIALLGISYKKKGSRAK